MIDMKRSFPYTDVRLFHVQNKATGKVCLHYSFYSRTETYVLLHNYNASNEFRSITWGKDRWK